MQTDPIAAMNQGMKVLSETRKSRMLEAELLALKQRIKALEEAQTKPEVKQGKK